MGKQYSYLTEVDPLHAIKVMSLSDHTFPSIQDIMQLYLCTRYKQAGVQQHFFKTK